MTENLNLKTVETVDTRPFRKLVMTIGELPTSFIESMTYYELLAWFTNYLETVIIPTVNNNGEAVEELQDKFIELKADTEQEIADFENDTNTEINRFETELNAAFTTLKNYVDNYFDNLDVQEEINNKLDDMAEAGTLQEIITQYINTTALWMYDNIASMKLATNLTDGSYTKTLGYANKNDEGGAIYKIRLKTAQDVADEMTLIALYDSTLIAEYVPSSVVNAKQFGCKGDGSTNDTTTLQAAITYASTNNLKLFIPHGTYMVSTLNSGDITISGHEAIIKAIENNTETVLMAVTGVPTIDNITFDGNSNTNTLLKVIPHTCNIKDCTFLNSTGDAVINQAAENDDGEAIFNNVNINGCVGGIYFLGYPYDDLADSKGKVQLINARISETGSSTNRMYMFQKLDYVYISGGEFFNSTPNGATNVYQVNHCEIIGGYYHDIQRGVTVGQVTKNFVISDTVNENLTGGAGLAIDLVTSDRVYPEAHGIVSNNVVKNAYRGIYVQGKNVVVNNNYVYCGTNTATSGGVIRFNNEDSNTSDSFIYVNNLYVLNTGNISGIINCGTAVIHFGDNIFINGNNVGYVSFTSTNPALFQDKISITSNTTLNLTNDIVVCDASAGSFNIFLPNNNESNLCGKEYLIIRTDDDTATGNTISLRCRSDAGNINGHVSDAYLEHIPTGVTKVIQLAKGEYWTLH